MSKPKSSLVALLLLPLLLLAGHSQAPLVTTDAPLKMLVVPIYPQYGYTTQISVMEASGLPTNFKVREFTEDGDFVPGEGEDRTLAENARETVIFHPLYLGETIENGWARIVHPENRNLHAVSTVYKYRNDPAATLSSAASAAAVEPAPAFRFFGFRWDREDQETAISIVNPTHDEQGVRVQMYVTYGKPLRRPVEARWTIAPMSRLSRFLSELIPLEESVGNPHHFGGIVRIIGESRIAVGALGFSHETGDIRHVPVVAEPQGVAEPPCVVEPPLY